MLLLKACIALRDNCEVVLMVVRLTLWLTPLAHALHHFFSWYQHWLVSWSWVPTSPLHLLYLVTGCVEAQALPLLVLYYTHSLTHSEFNEFTNTHTHTHICIYIYIYKFHLKRKPPTTCLSWRFSSSRIPDDLPCDMPVALSFILDLVGNFQEGKNCPYSVDNALNTESFGNVHQGVLVRLFDCFCNFVLFPMFVFRHNTYNPWFQQAALYEEPGQSSKSGCCSM